MSNRTNSTTFASTDDGTHVTTGRDESLSEFEWPPDPAFLNHESAVLQFDTEPAAASAATALRLDASSVSSIQALNGSRSAPVTPEPTSAPVMECAAPESSSIPSQPAPALKSPVGSHWSRHLVSSTSMWVALLGVIVLLQGAYILKTSLQGTADTTSSLVPTLPTKSLTDGTSLSTPPLIPGGLEIQTVSARAADTRSASAAPPPSVAKAPLGRLIVRSDPPGAKVFIDGRSQGVTPLSLASVTPGARRVVISFRDREVQQIVQVEPGTTASVIVPLASDSARTGRVAFTAPWEVDILEDGVLIGTSRTPELMLAAGSHVLRFVNEAFGYEHTQPVVVEPGRRVSVTVQVPQGKLNINALPWAEVTLDGKRIGETPLGDLSVAVGEHQVTFRHPELGEKTASVAVKVGVPARLSVDMRQ